MNHPVPMTDVGLHKTAATAALRQPSAMWALTVLTALLVFVWSVPHTIALRYLLLAMALALASWHVGRAALVAAMNAARIPLIALAMLTAWLVIQALLISPERDWALGEISGQWLVGIAALLLGLLLGALGNRRAGLAQRAALLAITTALLMLAAVGVGQSIAHYFTDGELLRQEVPITGGKLEMSFVVNILLAILAVDLVQRAAGSRPFLPLPVWTNCGAIAIGLASAYLAGARNGIIGLVFLGISGIVLVMFYHRRDIGLRRAFWGAAALAVMLAGFAYASYRADPRWKPFGESVAIGWDIDAHKEWLDAGQGPYPTRADGTTVDPSAYVRVAYIRAGLREIARHPLGVGYGRNAFGHSLRQTLPTRLGHAHSGFIDLGVGGGIPALALWLAWIAALFVVAWRGYFRHGSPSGLLLLLLLSGYTGRMVLDSVSKDHMLQLFMFLAGFLLIAAQQERRAEPE